jgi:hypothetical protein
MTVKHTLFIFLLPAVIFNSEAQTVRLNRLTDLVYETVLSEQAEVHLDVKPFTGNEVLVFDSLFKNPYSDRFTKRIFNDDLLSMKKTNIGMYMNPIVDVRMKYESSDPSLGIQARGGLSYGASFKEKVFVTGDFFVGRNDSSYAGLTEFGGLYTIPFYGKPLSRRNGSYLYASLTGDLCYRASDFFDFHIGRGKHFLGHGSRSLFLSDNTNAYPYVKASASVWMIKYIWMAMGLKDVRVFNDAKDPVLYDKAAFIHYLSLNLGKRINFDFFEAVITNPYDREGRRSGYEAAYFNPVIFYRPVEFYAGTSDNSLLGVGLNLRLFRSLYLYSQFMLDDLVISHINDGSGWWGNKYGIQAGMKAYRAFGVEGLFLRGEINMVSPYTYSHGEAYVSTGIANLNYGDMVRPFAHPLGSNFVEALAEARYRKGRFFAELTVGMATKGSDFPGDSVSYGGDVYRSYASRPDDYGVTFLQGLRTDLISIRPGVSYLVNPKWGLTLTLDAEYRAMNNALESEERFMIMGGVSCLIFNE